MMIKLRTSLSYNINMKLFHLVVPINYVTIIIKYYIKVINIISQQCQIISVINYW